MTIAVGVLAKDGVVVAADSQETFPGYWKIDQGKITAHVGVRLEPPRFRRAALVSGAGPASYVIDLGNRLRDTVADNSNPAEDSEAVGIRLEAVLREYTQAAIVPFAAAADPPNVYMLVAAQQNGRSVLWRSDRMALIRESQFASVGIGTAYADQLLARIWNHRWNVRTAAIAAAYVVHRVKNFIDGCGNRTDLLFLANDTFVPVPPSQMREIDAIFDEDVERIERDVLASVFGHDEGTRRNATRIRAVRKKLLGLIPPAP